MIVSLRYAGANSTYTVSPTREWQSFYRQGTNLVIADLRRDLLEC